MCTPIALMVGLGVASAGLNYASAQSVNSANSGAAAAWANDQRQKRTAENARQEAMRGQAEQARVGAVNQMDVASQDKARGEDEARLGAQLQQDAGVRQTPLSAENVTDANAGGADLKYASQNVRQQRATALNDATATAKQRIAAMAAVSSYGNSMNGLQTRNAGVLGDAARGIDMQGNLRKGSLGAFQVEGAVSPEKYQPAPWIGLVSGIGNALAGAGGSMAGNSAGYNSGAAFSRGMGG